MRTAGVLFDEVGARLGGADGEELHALRARLEAVFEATQQDDGVLGVERGAAVTEHGAAALEDHEHLVVVVAVHGDDITGRELRELGVEAALAPGEELAARSLLLRLFDQLARRCALFVFIGPLDLVEQEEGRTGCFSGAHSGSCSRYRPSRRRRMSGSWTATGMLSASRNDGLVDEPPSTAMTWPVTYDDSPDCRNSTAPAMSSGWPRRPSGSVAETSGDSSGVPSGRPMRLFGVAIVPGATEFTRMPYWPHSTAAVRMKPTMPALEAAYGMPYGMAVRPAMDAMSTMLPPLPWSTSLRPTACDVSSTERRLRLCTSSKTAGSRASSGDHCGPNKPPATCTRPCSGPRLAASATAWLMELGSRTSQTRLMWVLSPGMAASTASSASLRTSRAATLAPAS